MPAHFLPRGRGHGRPGRARTLAALRSRAGAEDGFTLLEMLVSIALITVVMTALTSLFVTSITSSNHLRAMQTATTLATSAIDHARSVGGVAAISGRNADRVNHQFPHFADTPVAPWLDNMDPAIDTSDATKDSAPELPTSPSTQTVGSRDFHTNYLVGICHRLFEYERGSLDCTNGAQDPDKTYVEFIRVVVAVTWKDSSCDDDTCYRIAAVLLNRTADPLFNFNTDPPDPPKLTDCHDQTVIIGQSVDIAVYGKAQSGEPEPICTLTDGVPSFTWASSELPDGLELSQDGRISGTVGGVAGSVLTELTVTDAMRSEPTSASKDTFRWTVYDGLTFDPLHDVEAFRDAPISPVPLAISGGSRHYTVTDNGSLPDGLALTGNATSGYLIAGTPAVDGISAVSLTATDTTTGQSVTRGFVMTVKDPTPTIENPRDQQSRIGEPFQLTVQSYCPTDSCDYSANFVGQSAGDSSEPWNQLRVDPDTSVITVSGTGPKDPTDFENLTITITTTGPSPQSATTEPFTWSFTDGPILQGPGDQYNHVNRQVSVDVRGDCEAGATCTYALAESPSWLTIDHETGRITGVTPANPTEEPVTVTMQDDADPPRTSTTTFTWHVYSEPSIASVGQQNWTTGEEIDPLDLDISCEWEPCRAEFDGSLPSGLTYSDGTLSGTPTSVGNGSFTLTVTDGGDEQATGTVTWTVAAGMSLSVGDQSSILDRAIAPLNLATATSGGTAPYTFEVTAGVLPEGLTLNPVTGSIVGTPTAVSDPRNVTITASDQEQHTTEATFTWSVSAWQGTIRSVAFPDYCLGVSGDSVTLSSSCSTTWTIEGDGTIQTTLETGTKCLRDLGSGKAPTIERCKPTRNSQQWTYDSSHRLVSGNDVLKARKFYGQYSVLMDSTSEGDSRKWTLS